MKWQLTWQTEAKWKISYIFLLSLLYFLSLALFFLCTAVFLFPLMLRLSSHPFPFHRLPTSIWLALSLALFSLCLTAVGLLWEVIRKNSTETHTAAAENKAFNTPVSPSLHYNSKRLGDGEEDDEGTCTGTTGISFGNDIRGKWCVGKTRFYPPADATFILLVAAGVTQEQKVRSCQANWKSRLRRWQWMASHLSSGLFTADTFQ